jgi:phosphoadenosine phosphosulfate reductase
MSKIRQLHYDSDSKIDEAIEFIKKYEPSEGYFLGFSGGKDSVVLYDLAKRSGVKFFPFYSATGIDPPEVVKFIKENYSDVVFKHPKKSFFAAIQDRGFPVRLGRWCCDFLKKDPTKNVPLKMRLMGIRAEESRMRAARERVDFFKNYKLNIYKPIFNWLEWEIWDYIETEKLPYCSLYDEGFDRIGCVVCPFLCHGKNKGKLKMHMERWPGMYKAFEHSMKRKFDDWSCVRNPRSGALNFRREWDFETFMNNWYDGI